ncbi:D-glycero-beta-D-manno-heptose 1,7-bisphosphate 7-phosphatase [Geobacter pelophilus]|uniref:D,D-heptose 1,7-bisphosphate phosphatase n=1 Tax=Geoanaerobacter pelophilus TaxID=60036 RepID=A0AAW4L6T6_9BACT|nr:D-glycero-beta-D-manno-heptose 1,7-bisphosphate 7-phosphatase [Geoanaerobacter pelophilus]
MAQPGVAKRRAVFIDRDGTINEEKEYLYRPEAFEFIPGVPEAIRILGEAGFLVVVVTNQSGVARGYYGEDDVRSLHRYMDELLLTAGAKVDAYYFCPHHPVNGVGEYRIDCRCRKPMPGMLLQAVSDLGIDLSASWMIGDKLADVEAGIAAGCRSAMVLTGYGTEEQTKLPVDVPVFKDLLAAAQAILTELPD